MLHDCDIFPHPIVNFTKFWIHVMYRMTQKSLDTRGNMLKSNAK